MLAGSELDLVRIADALERIAAVMERTIGPTTPQPAASEEPDPLPVEPDPPARRGLVGVREAAEILGVHPRTIHRYLSRGEIDAVKIGGHWRIEASSLPHPTRAGPPAPLPPPRPRPVTGAMSRLVRDIEQEEHTRGRP